MEIKKINLQDLEVLEDMERRCFPMEYYSKIQLEDMLKNSLYQMYSIDNKGYTIIMDNGIEIEILKIGVIEDFRKQKIGSKLLNYLFEMGKEIFLEVRESNIVGQKFYENNGFIKIGKRKNYYKDGETAILMKRDIN